jgi:hypothetical protein
VARDCQKDDDFDELVKAVADLVVIPDFAAKKQEIDELLVGVGDSAVVDQAKTANQKPDVVYQMPGHQKKNVERENKTLFLLEVVQHEGLSRSDVFVLYSSWSQHGNENIHKEYAGG